MIEKEKTADNLINSLINTGNSGVLILNLLTIAFIPAIAEELIFRGVLQKIFGRLFKSGHAGIWFTAFLFSTVHFQFFGFVPRFILGLAFGYLYFWGGSLWLPVIAHFVNNAFPVVFNFFQGKVTLNDPTDIALWKQAVAVPIPLFVIYLVMVYFRNKKRENKESSGTGIPQTGI
jgi:membrane protease YdiL (CAAX protease family)